MLHFFEMGFPNCLKNYFLFSFIDEGASAQVFTAMSKITQKTVAIKIIDISDKDEKAKDEAIREIEIMKELDSPFVIKIYEYFIESDKIYIVMEYCEHGSLLNIIGENQMNERQISFILFEIMLALNDLQKRGICHRDLKLENILVDNYGHIRLADFGISLKIKQDDELTFYGTPLYVSPEIVKHQSYTEKTDIWSLGVIAYALLFRAFPFQSENIMDLFKQITNEKPLFPSKRISKEIKDLITLMLDKDQTTRISLEQCFKHEFFVYNNPLNMYFHDHSGSIRKEDIDITEKDLWCIYSHWSFPQIDEKISKLVDTPINEIHKMMESHEINSVTAAYKQLRDAFMKNALFYQFGSFSNNFSKTTLFSISKKDNTVEVLSKAPSKNEGITPSSSSDSNNQMKKKLICPSPKVIIKVPSVTIVNPINHLPRIQRL